MIQQRKSYGWISFSVQAVEKENITQIYVLLQMCKLKITVLMSVGVCTLQTYNLCDVAEVWQALL